MPAARRERSDELDAELLAAVRGLDLPAWYYALCDDFPQRAGEYSPAGEAMRAAWQATGLTVRAPGKRMVGAVIGDRRRSLQVTMVPARYCGMVDLTVELRDGHRYGVDQLHSWALTLTEEAGHQPPNPPYPRPWAMSDAELVPIAQRVADHVVDLARVLDVEAAT